MKRFPSLDILAATDIGDVLLMWQGLGYYTRAKKIHECAKVLMEKYNGQFPQNRDELLKLPGIGPYTASSICAFAFNMPETVVDGNVIRVIARLYGITDEINREDIYRRACALTPQKHGADYASAIMDLGATICTPTSPKCLLCPWHKECVACELGITEQIPLIKKPEKQKRIGTLYLIQNEQGGYYIQKRAGKGLLSGLYEFPWHYDNEPSFEGNWQDTGKTIIHVFTHFHLTLHIVKGEINCGIRPDGVFAQPNEVKNYPFPTLMKKVIKGL
jgi:A/G-specific adenine glycosylase